ncbi:MAG: cupin-like domain-containing protein [Campylobacterota bacterium]|nr:cupin-like domain-containing protein [Campylobacterota bacterium]
MISLENIEKIENISSTEFMSNYKASATPVVMKNLTKEWRARKKWSLEYFEELGSDVEVKLYDSKPSSDDKLQHAAEKTLPLKEYFNLLRSGEKDLRMFFFQILKEIPALQRDFNYPDLGVKFFKKLPVMFLAGEGAKVQMHYDIDYADIILCHFGAKKRVVMFSPEQTKYMYHVPFSYSALFDVDFANPDYKKYPALARLKGFETTLEHGDALYIPPGWWHNVEYEGISYSLALRAFPRTAKNFLKMLHNIVIIRTVEGIMRKLFSQRWNDRNTRVACEKTNKNIENL